MDSKETNPAVKSGECGETMPNENNIFAFRPSNLQANGRYKLLITQENSDFEQIIEVVIDEAFAIGNPKIKSIYGITSDRLEEIGSNHFRVLEKVSIKPTIELASTGCALSKCIVQTTWKSLIFSSVLLADSDVMNAKIIPAYELEAGEHSLFIATLDTETNLVSDTIQLDFTVDPILPIELNLGDNVKIPVIIIAIVIAAFVGTGTAIYLRKRYKKTDQEKVSAY
jgi:hypothetical protein